MKRQTGKAPSAPDHDYALSCAHCTDTCDSRGRYVSTYCHLRHEHLAGFSGDGPLPCRSCGDYMPRGRKGGLPR